MDNKSIAGILYETAELLDVTDPNLVFDLRAKLDGAGFYDDFEVNRVVAVELNPKRQGDLVAALQPVLSRLLARHKAAQERRRAAEARWIPCSAAMRSMPKPCV